MDILFLSIYGYVSTKNEEIPITGLYLSLSFLGSGWSQKNLIGADLLPQTF